MTLACGNSEISLEQLPNKVIRHDSLPTEIKDFLINWKEYKVPSENRKSGSLSDVICLDELYRFEAISTWYGPWTSHFLLSNINGLRYRIDPPQSFPFIVFKKGLYICTDYNYLQHSSKNYKNIIFVRYQLE